MPGHKAAGEDAAQQAQNDVAGPETYDQRDGGREQRQQAGVLCQLQRLLSKRGHGDCTADREQPQPDFPPQ